MVEGKTRRERVRNTTKRVSLKSANMKCHIKVAQLRWFGQVQRMDEDRFPK